MMNRIQRKTPLKRKAPVKNKVRAGTIYKAVNPATGRVISVRTAKDKAWTAFARYIRRRDPFCITCSDRTTEAGHFLHNTDKVNKKLGGNMLWFDERNVNGQEGVCNRHHSGMRDVYAIKLEEKYGFGILQELYKLYRTEKKWTIAELLEVETRYTQKLKEMEGYT